MESLSALSRYPMHESKYFPSVRSSEQILSPPTQIYEDGLIPVETETENKVYPVHTSFLYSKETLETTPSSPTELPERPTKINRLCGVRRRLFWAIAIVGLVMVLAGAGVGAWLGMRKSLANEPDTPAPSSTRTATVSEIIFSPAGSKPRTTTDADQITITTTPSVTATGNVNALVTPSPTATDPPRN